MRDECARMDTMIEEWKDIKGYEGRYQVSNLGRVRNASGLIMKQELHYKGHLKIRLYRSGDPRGTKYFVHRLVAIAFCPDFEAEQVVNHRNGVKRDNAWSNLEWTSSGDNTRHHYNGVRMMEEREATF